MAKITNNMIPHAYDIAKKVYEGQMGLSEGKIEINRLSGMTFGSTGAYINNLHYMLSGERYTRTMNLYATEYYLEHIGQDYGGGKLKLAAQAVKKHVEYYKTVHGYLRSTDRLAKKYL